jgi:L-lysine exporter family protein LysE/ArgO
LILSFAEGFMLGLGAAVPLGPINILIMNESIKKYKNGMTIGLGAMSADITYLFFIFFGLLNYINQPEVLNSLSVLGGVFLLYLAFMIFKKRDAEVDTSSEQVQSNNRVKLYTKGFALTFINPYTIGFWLSVSGYIVSKNLEPLIVLVGMLSAILLWITIMPYIVHKSKHRISQGVFSWINRISSFILACFAIMMFINLLTKN